MAKKRPGERRVYPWRAALTDVACSGTHLNLAEHLPITFAQLDRRDPMHAPYEYSCPRCGVTAPSMWWDRQVPVPPHEFIEPPASHGYIALNWQCRVCLQATDNTLFHPKSAVGPFDPAKIWSLHAVESTGDWEVRLDESIGFAEGYVDRVAQIIVLSSDTYKVISEDDDAYDLILGLDSTWRTSDGMRFLMGVPAFDAAVAKFRTSRGDGVVQAKDELTQLAELLTSLATQAIGVGADGELEARQILMGRYLGAKDRVEALEVRLDRLREQLDQVAMGVMAFG